MLLIENARVVTMDADDRILDDGALLIDRDRIADVGPRELMHHRYPQVRRFNAKQGTVFPGLIDAHNHPFNYLVGGHGDDLPIKQLLYEVFYPYERFITPEDAYISALSSYAEMIRSGVTCFNDAGGYMPDPLAQAALDIGIRGIITRSTRDMHVAENAMALGDSTEQALQNAVDVVEKWHGAAHGRLRAWFGIRLALSASDALIRHIGELARQYQVGVHTHAATATFEKQASMDRFGKRTLDRYRDLGLLAPNVLAVHMGFLDDDEIPTIVDSGIKVAHCPVAAMAGAWGILKAGRIPELMENGVIVALGSDTNFGSGTLDMFRQMFVCATAHREHHGHPSLIGAEAAFRMATTDAARALLWEKDIGSLEVGKKADLFIADTSRLEWRYPGRSVLASAVYSGSRSDVRDVMIDGDWVLRDRRLETIDETSVCLRMEHAGRQWRQRASDAGTCAAASGSN